MSEIISFAIDPGHPSKLNDRGCQVGNGWEDDYTIALAREVFSDVRALGDPWSQFKPFLTRKANDEIVDHDERMKRALQGGARFILSIHVDSNENPNHHGSKALINEGDMIGDHLGVALMAAMPSPLRHWATTFVADKELWPRSEYVLRHFKGIPTVLWEVCYATNPVDLAGMFQVSVVAGLRAAVLSMLTRYLQIDEKMSGGYDVRTFSTASAP